MIKLKWVTENVPSEMEIRQVYGVVFNEEGKTLIRCELKKGKKVYSLAGGTPEPFETTMEETLRREFVEEVNTTLKNEIYYIGYQEVDEDNGTPIYAQVRMTALIDEIGKLQPDPDTGDTYERLLVSPKKAIELLSWGEIGEKLIISATKLATEKFGIKPSEDDEIIFV
ncbi:MAG: NUDIX domain-containing protein [Clostridia bacterium]|nr:NUDIX domain-containing protein [Clostridia bacterium]